MSERAPTLARTYLTLLLAALASGCASLQDPWWSPRQLSRPPGHLVQGSDAVFLRKDRINTFHLTPNYQFSYILHSHHYAVQILTPAGMDHAILRVPLARSAKLLDLSARVISPAGAARVLDREQIYKTGIEVGEQTTADVRSFTLPRVKVGDIIEVKVLIKSPQIYYADMEYVGIDEPILDYRLAHRFPRANTFSRFKLYNAKGQWRRERKGAHDVVSLRLKNIRAFGEEPWSPPRRSYVPYWAFSVKELVFADGRFDIFQSWHDIRRRAFSRHEANEEELLRDFEAPALAGQGDSARQRLDRALAWVRDEVTQGGGVSGPPRPLRQVAQQGMATSQEKALLLAYTLREQGFRALLALARPASRGPLDKGFPLPGELPESLVFVLAQRGIKGALWLSPSCRYCESGQVPLELQGQPALLLRREVAAGTRRLNAVFRRIKALPPAPPEILTHTVLTVDAHGDATAETVISEQGRARPFRDRLRLLNRRQRRQELERYLSRMASAAEVLSYALMPSSRPGAPCQVKISWRAAGLASPAAEKLLLPLSVLKLGDIGEVFKRPRRKNPIWISAPVRYIQQVTVVPPRGFHVLAPAVEQRVRGDFGSRHVTVNAKNNRTQVSVRLDLSPGQYPPSSYPALRTFIQEADKVSNTLVALEKIPQ